MKKFSYTLVTKDGQKVGGVVTGSNSVEEATAVLKAGHPDAEVEVKEIAKEKARAQAAELTAAAVTPIVAGDGSANQE